MQFLGCQFQTTPCQRGISVAPRAVERPTRSLSEVSREDSRAEKAGDLSTAVVVFIIPSGNQAGLDMAGWQIPKTQWAIWAMGKSSHKVAVRCRVWLPKDSDCKISTGPWVEKLQPEHWIRIWLKPGIPQIQHFKSRWKLLAVGKPFFWTHDSSFFPHDKPMIGRK